MNKHQIGEYLKGIRLKKGISLRQMASLMQTHTDSVYRIEKGENYTIETFEKYCDILAVEIDKIKNKKK